MHVLVMLSSIHYCFKTIILNVQSSVVSYTSAQNCWNSSFISPRNMILAVQSLRSRGLRKEPGAIDYGSTEEQTRAASSSETFKNNLQLLDHHTNMLLFVPSGQTLLQWYESCFPIHSYSSIYCYKFKSVFLCYHGKQYILLIWRIVI